MDHLLRDIHFHIQTDHENLTRHKVTGSPKVLRWKLDIQQFNFTIVHIKGTDNVVADDFSRQCAREDLEEEEEIAAIFSHQCEQLDVEYCAALDPDECYMHYLSTDDEPVATVMEGSRDSDYIELAAITELEVTKIPDTAYKAIGKVHNSLAGHHGVEKTMLKLTRVGSKWPYMREHIRLFIKACPCCQKMSNLRIPIHTTPFTTSSYAPMMVVNIDSIGPLPKDSAGNQYVLTIIDTFTRYTELYAIKDVGAEASVQPLLDHIGRYGCPVSIQSDNGPQFVNDLIGSLLRLVGTSHALTLAYSKEENAIVERANKEALRHLRALVFETGTNTDWSIRLPLVTRIVNSTVHSAIGVSPAALLYGNAINLDRGIFLPMEAIDSSEKPISEWSDKMLHMQQSLLDKAQRRQELLNAKHTLGDGNEEQPTYYPPNSLVLAMYPDGPLGHRPPTKLHTNLQGPFRVISNIGAKYTLYDFVTDSEIQRHIKMLQPYHATSQNPSPESIALKDRGEFVVNSIVRHSGNPNRKSDMDFLVRWEGYTAADDQWLPWRALRNNPKLHEYLRFNQLEKLVPKEHRAII
jgi:transposase InsO family protein